LSRVLSYATDDLDRIATNPCIGLAGLYAAYRSAIIWSDGDIAALKAEAFVEIGQAIDLAAGTALRLSDLLRLSWSHIGADAIVMSTGKSRGSKRSSRSTTRYASLAGIQNRS
jgi:hypothetical protein